MKFKLFLVGLWAAISSLWRKASDEVKHFAPIAINAVNVLKGINESFAGDIIETALSSIIPGKADDALIRLAREKLKVILPRVLTGLNISNAIAQIQDPNEQLKAIVAAINLSPDEAKNAHYHSLSALILNCLADGKLTWSESVQIAEYYYTNIHKK